MEQVGMAARLPAAEGKALAEKFAFGLETEQDGECCLRCGRGDHSSDECRAKLPAWPAGYGEGARA